MLYNYSEAVAIYKTDYKLKKAILDKKFFKVEKGIYSDGKTNYKLIEVILKKYKNAFIVKDSALYYYGFTDEEPEKIHIGTARNAVRIKDKRVVQHFYKDFDKEGVEFFGYTIKHILNMKNVQNYITKNGNEIRILNFHALVYDFVRDKRRYSNEKFESTMIRFIDNPLDEIDMDDFEENLFRDRVGYDNKLWRMLKEIERNAFHIGFERSINNEE